MDFSQNSNYFFLTTGNKVWDEHKINVKILKAYTNSQRYNIYFKDKIIIPGGVDWSEATLDGAPFASQSAFEDWVYENTGFRTASGGSGAEIIALQQEKTDKGGYSGTSQDLKDEIDNVSSGYRGTVAIADTPTQDGIYTPMEAGTYANAGGLVYDPYGVDKGFDVKFIKTGSEWVKRSVDINFDTSEIKEEITFYDYPYKGKGIFSIIGFMRPNGTTSNSDSYRRSNFIDITGISKLKINVQVGSLSASPCVFFDDNLNYISGITASTVNESEIIISAIPINAKYIVVSTLFTFIDQTDDFYIKADISIKNVVSKNEKEVYVSLDGNDTTGNGTILKPFLSYTKALDLLSNEGTVVFKGGDYYMTQPFQLKSNIRGENGTSVRFINGGKITSAALEAGKNRVYKVTTGEAINTGNFLWQHDIDDDETEITSLKRHPLHNGKTYRLGSKRIYQATSIQEIEDTTNKLMWFKSGSNLYFSKEDVSDLSLNPIVNPRATALLYKGNFDINNIQILYGATKTDGYNGTVENCSIGYVNSQGSFIYDNSTSINFTKCEFFACNNDGANGHSNIPSDIFSNVTKATFKECWFHDNSDDGESCHEYSQTTHYGSLVEYNGNGITPASGGHSVCYNSTCRNNGEHPWSVGEEGSGFSAQGSPVDGGESTDIWCYNCLSENNGIGFRSHNEGNTFINCVSKDDTTAFAGPGVQINCVTT